MKMFEDWEMTDTWSALAMLLVIAAAILGCIVFFAPKNVDYYYISHGANQNQASTCVYAHWTWHTDEISFCTDDATKAEDFAAKANAGLKGK